MLVRSTTPHHITSRVSSLQHKSKANSGPHEIGEIQDTSMITISHVTMIRMAGLILVRKSFAKCVF
jgi:hypothetical protein